MGTDVVLNSEGKEHKIGFIIKLNVSKTFPIFKGYFWPFQAVFICNDTSIIYTVCNLSILKKICLVATRFCKIILFRRRFFAAEDRDCQVADLMVKFANQFAIARSCFLAYASGLMRTIDKNFGFAPVLLSGFLGMITFPGWCQIIPNPSFEEVAVPAGALFLDPQTPGYPELVPALKWAFGMPCGICVEGTAYAEQVLAADGKQVAYLQGDPSGPNGFPIKSIMGVDVSGLKPGQSYEISWSQTGRATDLGTCGVTVTLSAPDFPPIELLSAEKVETRGKWQRIKREFLAPTDTLRLNIQHLILESKNPDFGSESTLFDDFKIKPVK